MKDGLTRVSSACHNAYAHMNSTQRAHILIPADLLREIDALVGPRGRTAFLLETAKEELRRRKLLSFLESKDAAWKEKDHPEEHSAAWVRKLPTRYRRQALRIGCVLSECAENLAVQHGSRKICISTAG